MTGDLELKLQAYLDGELNTRDAARVEDWLESNEEAQLLLSELTMTKEAMSVGEMERSLPESGDFYWSKIRRDIDRVERLESTGAEPSWILGFRRLMAPAAGFAMLALIAFVLTRAFGPSSATEDYMVDLVEVETPSEDVGAYSFRSEVDNMFVVWVYERGPAEDETSLVTDDL